MSKPSLDPENKSDDVPRFTSINSITKKLSADEDVLQFALKEIETISKESNILDSAFSYEFDVFEFSNHTDRPLLVLGIYLLSKAETFTKLIKETKEVDLSSCAHFLNLCETLYHNNPYHNNIHAADVMQYNLILLQSSFIQHHFEDYELLAAFMSAVAHDIGHIGKNNDFLVKTKHNLAIKFNNISCLENYHIEQFHQTITDHSKANWIKLFDDKIREYIINIVEYAILGTDMGVYHNTIKQELKQNYTKEFVSKSYTKKLSIEEKKFIIRAMLHLSDISNPMRPFSVCQQWANRVNEEFFNQGDVMKDMGLEVSALCNREETNVIKNQQGFVQFCVKPLATSLHEMIKELDWCLKNIEMNDKLWTELKEKQQHQQHQLQPESPNDDKSTSSSSSTETDVAISSGSFNSQQSEDLI